MTRATRKRVAFGLGSISILSSAIAIGFAMTGDAKIGAAMLTVGLITAVATMVADKPDRWGS